MMDPHRSFVDGDDYPGPEHFLQFPDSLDREIEVPYPVENHPDWTTTPLADVDIPASFPNLVNLPDPTLEPAYYSAAVTTIRATNDYFRRIGHYNANSLTEAELLATQQRWLSMVDEAGNAYPLPPDTRSLYVQESVGDPLTKEYAPLWMKACLEVAGMDDATWEHQLGNRWSKFSIDEDAGTFIHAVFVHYLVWNELVTGLSARAQAFQDDQQPTSDQLEDHFTAYRHDRGGPTLADVCRSFPHARNAQMLVFRVDYYALLTLQPSTTTETGAVDPVESRYEPKLDPTWQGIELVLKYLKSGKATTVSELAYRYWPSLVNNRLIINWLNEGAKQDVTTGRFIHKETPAPSEKEIENVLRNDDYLNGFVYADIAERFPNRVGRLKEIGRQLRDSTYWDDYEIEKDEEERRFFPLYREEDEDGEFPYTNREESIWLRNRARIKQWDPDTIERDYIWVRACMRYVPRPGRFLLNYDHEDEQGSPTEAATSPGPSLPSPKVHTLQISNITAVETAPWRASTLVTEAPDDSPVAAEPTRPTGDRPSKRPATEPAGPGKRTKRGRKNPKIRCSARTRKGFMCKRVKDQEDGEDEWYCNVHAGE